MTFLSRFFRQLKLTVHGKRSSVLHFALVCNMSGVKVLVMRIFIFTYRTARRTG